MGMADGLELPGTFGIQKNRIKILIAGNEGNLAGFSDSSEDDMAQASADINAANVSAKDCLICISASGTTPYAVSALEAALRSGAKTIGVANNPDTAILSKADIAVYLNTPPEIIPGSTRLGAATAQKIALNMMSTLMGIHLGHVHDGYMVNVQADNTKLVKRACSIIASVSGCATKEAQNYLDNSHGSVKLAIMLASGAMNIDEAKEILEINGQKLRPSLSVLKGR
jgi:N-acetylmuramic acid 6-phosphate etherase